MRQLLVLAVAAIVAAAPKTLAAVGVVADGEARAVIVLGPNPTWLETHAAEELNKYVEAMTGVSLPVTSAAGPAWPESLNQILIGRPQTHPHIADLVRAGRVRLSGSQPGLDGFVIKTVSHGDHEDLVLGGSMDRGTLYAVYDLLERVCHVGFFWDAEQIPHYETLTFTDLDISERPYFPVRQYMQGCAFYYSEQFWPWEMWKRELDWAAKKKQNRMHLPGGPVPPSDREWTEWEKYDVGQAKARYNYARQLGIEIGQNPASREGIELYGTDHIYNADPFAEVIWNISREEQIETVVRFARDTMASFKQLDPQAVWYASGWPMCYDKSLWTPEVTERFLAEIPTDSFYICDIWAERHPIYKDLNYFFGKQWGWSVLHSMGGWTTLHGNLAGLIRGAKEVTQDPRAKNCIAFYIDPEIIHHNFLYFDCATDLSWDPRDVTLEAFLADYALRRYGPQGGPRMLPALRELVRSVYSTDDETSPSYQRTIFPGIRKEVTDRFTLIEPLRNALDIALANRDLLGDYPTYQVDLVDWCRQYLGELFNYDLAHAIEAFSENDRDRCLARLYDLETILSDIEMVLGSSDFFTMQEEFEWAASQPTPPGGQPNDEALRKRVSALGGLENYPQLLDYACHDWYELVRFYYRPRVDAFIREMRRAIAAGEELDMGKVNAQYREICERWVKEGGEVRPGDRGVAPQPSGRFTEAAPTPFPEARAVSVSAPVARQAAGFAGGAVAAVQRVFPRHRVRNGEIDTRPIVPKVRKVSVDIPAGMQRVEGFARIVKASHEGDYITFLGNVYSWWEYNAAPEYQSVVWETAPVPEKCDTAFAWIGGNGEDPGEIELLVDSQHALTFRSQEAQDAVYQEGHYKLVFKFKGYQWGHSGVYVLFVPAEAITPGKPLTLTARHISGRGPSCWYMINNFTDVMEKVVK